MDAAWGVCYPLPYPQGGCPWGGVLIADDPPPSCLAVAVLEPVVYWMVVTEVVAVAATDIASVAGIVAALEVATDVVSVAVTEVCWLAAAICWSLQQLVLQMQHYLPQIKETGKG